jgi:hypothetical protein
MKVRKAVVVFDGFEVVGSYVVSTDIVEIGSLQLVFEGQMGNIVLHHAEESVEVSRNQFVYHCGDQLLSFQPSAREIPAALSHGANAHEEPGSFSGINYF